MTCPWLCFPTGEWWEQPRGLSPEFVTMVTSPPGAITTMTDPGWFFTKVPFRNTQSGVNCACFKSYPG